MSTELPSEEYLTPLYSQRDVAQILGASPSTVQRWLMGYGTGGDHREPLVSGVDAGKGYTVPFLGLAEAFVLNAFRKAGLPMQRIRPAVDALKREFGLEYVLASNRLAHDGAEILLRSEDEHDRRLVVVRDGQAVFNEVVEDYLKNIDFTVGYASKLHLPQYRGLDVTVQPVINGGRPTLERRGIALADVLGRVRAGESPRAVADDYGVEPEDVFRLNVLAA
ncbi:DUF433 domain-containing protein [Leifsonia sp. SIMBA_070]|uniref:DUF433 domain-containing protein n=1 Tax=Leifsonia sp. SIMBA_070 TaxID=3085810 RepID=UPI00397972C9